MQTQPGSGQVDVPAPDEVARLILDTLLVRHPALVAIEELVRDFGHHDERKAVPAMLVEEGVNDLVCCGLAHRLDRFAFASYSAVRASCLTI